MESESGKCKLYINDTIIHSLYCVFYLDVFRSFSFYPRTNHIIIQMVKMYTQLHFSAGYCVNIFILFCCWFLFSFGGKEKKWITLRHKHIHSLTLNAYINVFCFSFIWLHRDTSSLRFKYFRLFVSFLPAAFLALSLCVCPFLSFSLHRFGLKGKKIILLTFAF